MEKQSKYAEYENIKHPYDDFKDPLFLDKAAWFINNATFLDDLDCKKCIDDLFKTYMLLDFYGSYDVQAIKNVVKYIDEFYIISQYTRAHILKDGKILTTWEKFKSFFYNDNEHKSKFRRYARSILLNNRKPIEFDILMLKKLFNKIRFPYNLDKMFLFELENFHKNNIHEYTDVFSDFAKTQMLTLKLVNFVAPTTNV